MDNEREDALFRSTLMFLGERILEQHNIKAEITVTKVVEMKAHE